uniref:MAPEG family protein n=1 Tax=Lotharella oceanica TaxID=641309 RepID=A0A7S2TW54_9EUKA|mmetsp:Transcript_32661/g.60742  ORF Transcript_32661/g.60742 Transcript_32661/m.60742 type:complete len:181 (+) Transcript_32661:48-590(+)|eukprot:CAMPEP_0170167738 /NCGR_PEP_ID=MMETSP0040_2-20121228/1055_1 /TAXON_ID=641309 /ORGANISM="Lotharella oceanica, Strain CCMP622" /LENGTH=180 /DNA_ID=CAMNT_0010405851 /DNA_START=48 /DNA_END=590 /DNA_ORIENTATION=-
MSFVPPALAFLKDTSEILGLIAPYMDQVKPVCTPIESLLAAWFIAYCAHMIGVFAGGIATGKVDNVAPRQAKSKAAAEKGIFGNMTAYAMNAHNNRLEGFALYAAAVILCIVTKVDGTLLAKICTLYLITSAAFVAIYVLTALFPSMLKPPVSLIRSSVWFSNTLIACVLVKLASENASK